MMEKTCLSIHPDSAFYVGPDVIKWVTKHASYLSPKPKEMIHCPHEYTDFMKLNENTTWSMMHGCKMLEEHRWSITFVMELGDSFSRFDHSEMLLPIANVNFCGIHTRVMMIVVSFQADEPLFMFMTDEPSCQVVFWDNSLQGLLTRMYNYTFLEEFWLCFPKEVRQAAIDKETAKGYWTETLWEGKLVHIKRLAERDTKGSNPITD